MIGVSILLLKCIRQVFLLFYFKNISLLFCYEHILNEYCSVFIDNISHQTQMVVDKHVGVLNVICLNY